MTLLVMNFSQWHSPVISWVFLQLVHFSSFHHPVQAMLVSLLDLCRGLLTAPPSPTVTWPTPAVVFSRVGWAGGRRQLPSQALCSGFPRSCVPYSLALFQFLLLTVLCFVCSLAIMLCPFISAQGHFKDSGKKSFAS